MIGSGVLGADFFDSYFDSNLLSLFKNSILEETEKTIMKYLSFSRLTEASLCMQKRELIIYQDIEV